MSLNANITITWDQFKVDFPEFNTDTVTDPLIFQFTVSQFNYYFNLAQLLIDPSNRAPSLANTLAEVFIAHHMVLEAMAQRDMNLGGLPGVAKGPVTGKSAGDVSVTYAPQATMELNASHWNYTIYGQRFINLARIVGAGPIQVGANCGSGAGAYPGPLFYGN